MQNLSLGPHQLIIVIGGVGARFLFWLCYIMGVYLSRDGMDNYTKIEK